MGKYWSFKNGGVICHICNNRFFKSRISFEGHRVKNKNHKFWLYENRPDLELRLRVGAHIPNKFPPKIKEKKKAIPIYKKSILSFF